MLSLYVGVFFIGLSAVILNRITRRHTKEIGELRETLRAVERASWEIPDLYRELNKLESKIDAVHRYGGEF